MSAQDPGPDGGENPAPREGEREHLPPPIQAALRRYWRANLTLMIGLLSIWALVGLGCGVLWADWLNAYRLGGYPLGFWFAQQGSILVFVLLILIYAVAMNGLDNKHHRELEALRRAHGTGEAGEGTP